ncbi:hypothetical protein CK203_110282 [Vitis vinifera]|uniref:Integrase catalytic domain-containing protein n=1 Tax=Vitis vinifera TaxID=29760 RepID=A0A438CAF1_VITVI|nr:hypothetical protein CK203_110282 [Vitis vinifera]
MITGHFEISDIVDGAMPCDEYVDEMLALSLSQIEEIVQPELTSPFDLFGIFDIDDEIAQHDSDDDSSSISDSDPLIREFHLLLIQLLRAYLDVFAWSYEDMPGLDPSIVQHRLPLLPHARPVKQKLRRLHPRWSLQEEEIQKQLSVGFLSVVEYRSGWPMSSLFPKRTASTGHSMLSFMDGFSWYSQILMAPEDMEKTSFITEWRERHRGRPDKIRAILDMPASRTERESQPTVWDDQCQRAFERIREYLLSPPVLAPPTPANHSGYGIGVLLISPHGDHIPDLFVWHSRIDIRPRTTLLKPVFDALATLASMIDIPADATIRHLLIESRFAPTYCFLIDDTEIDDEVHAGVCGPHMGGHMLARKIMRIGYFWLTMETDCCQFVQRCPKSQIHGDLIHVPSSELHALTSPWPFSIWGINIIEKISPKSSSGHEFILVAIDYFTKWVEAASYERLTSAGVASFTDHTLSVAMESS